MYMNEFKIKAEDKYFCHYCGEKVKVGDYLLTYKPDFMCEGCYVGKTIFPICKLTSE